MTADEKLYSAYATLKKARADKRLKGYREKKAKDAEEAAVGGAAKKK